MPTKDEIVNFSSRIETIKNEKNLSYIDSVVLYCEETGFEIELAAKLLSKNIMVGIREEAEELNFLPKSKTVKLLF